MKRTAKYTPRRLNRYVPAMAYSADVILGGPHEVRFGPVALASTTLLLNAQAVVAATAYTTILNDGNTDPVNDDYSEEFPHGPGFGRCLQIAFGAANAGIVTISGRDYLGQPVTESFTANGTTPVIGVKAFKWVDSVTSTLAGDISVGTTDKLGLPYATQNILGEQADGARVATLGTFVSPSYTDPQTATTADPRGTYDPTTTLDGVKFLSAEIIVHNALNADGNGGLYGLAHYGA